MKKICKLCGAEFDTIKNGHTRKYCFSCVPKYSLDDKDTHNQNMKIKHRAIKQHLVNLKGGKCSICGYDKCINALEFHHIDNRKDFGIAETFHTLEKYYDEIDKCVLLCANCHIEEHEKLRQSDC